MDLILGEENDKRNRKSKSKGKQNKASNNKPVARKGKKQDQGNQHRQEQGAESRQSKAKKNRDVRVSSTSSLWGGQSSNQFASEVHDGSCQILSS